MKKKLIIHYILVVAGAGLVAAASYMLTKDTQNMWSKLIVAFAGLFVMFSQYFIIKTKKKSN